MKLGRAEKYKYATMTFEVYSNISFKLSDKIKKNISREHLFLQMHETLNVMKQAANIGKQKKVYSLI